ncbi:MAG: M23 family metallopeptidase [Leptospirales bacterium]|jgi:murein DD-endopeptidase MepM/ murein hydrolase activator NlpD
METSAPKDKRFTVLLVPSPSDRIRRFEISGRWIRWGTVAGAIFGIFLLLFSALSVALFEKEARMISLQHKSRAQKEEIVRTYRKLQDIHSKMVDVAKLERKVRLIMNTSESNGSNVVLGLGGPTQTVAPSVLIQKGKRGMDDLMAEMDRQIGDLGQGVINQEESLANLKRAIRERQSEWAYTPSIWPTRGVMTSRFGYRTSPFGLGRDFHPGIDIAGSIGTPIMATASGTVTLAGWDQGFGKTVVIDHSGTISTLYGHLEKVNVYEGEQVKRGEVIGYLGNTGLSTGPHLHYQIMVNHTPVNPKRYILNRF